MKESETKKAVTKSREALGIRTYATKISNIAWVSLLVIGIFLILSSYLKGIWAHVTWRPDILGLGIGVVSLSVASLAMNISLKTDKRVTAIADSEFYEKMAVIQGYKMSISLADSDEYNRAYADKIFYDLKAAKQLKQWVSKAEVKDMLDSEIENLIAKALSGQKYEHLIKRLQQIKGKEDDD